MGQSAGLGALIGFPAGIILTLAANEFFASSALSESSKDYSEEIQDNQNQIVKNNAEIEDLRRQANEETSAANPSPAGRKHIYDGPTLGNLYR